MGYYEMECNYEIQIKCACGAIMTAKTSRELTAEEKKSLEGRKCGLCYLQELLERDLQTV
jgi:hypothetical protein